MKTDRKTKTEKSPPKVKTVKANGRAAPRTNGKHPLTYEHIPVGIVEASLDGNYMDVNVEFCRILGYSRSELLRRNVKDCTHEDDYAVDFTLYEQLIAGKIPFYRLEKRYARKDGGSIWVELTRSLVRDAKGKPLYTVGLVLDISDRKDVERVLRDSVERLRLATGAAQMFMWEWDFQTQSYTIADNFEHVLGFSAGLLPKNKLETIRALSPEADVKYVSEEFARAIEKQRDLHSLPIRVINPENGQVVWLEVSAKIVYDHKGTPERMFGVAQNITENKNIQDQIAIISLVPEENPNPVMRITRDGNIVYANPVSAALLDDWMQGTIPEVLRHTITQAFHSGVKTEVEIRHRGRVFSFTLAPIVDGGYVNLYGKDITERKQAEESLTAYGRRQEALYRLSDQLHRVDSLENVFNAALDAILSALQCDRASILLYDYADVMRFVAWRGLSDAYRMATDGHSPWTPDAKNPQPISMDNVRSAELTEELRTIIQQEGIGSLAFIPLVLNGKLIGKFMMYFNTPHAFNERELDLCLTIGHQLAFGIEQKRAEQQLRAKEAELEDVINHTPFMLTRCSRDLRYRFVSRVYAEMIGRTPEEVAGKPIVEFMGEEGLRTILPYVEAVLEGNQVEFETEVSFKGAGSPFLHVVYTPDRDEKGNVIGWFASIVDISERKRAEEKISQSEERFRQAANAAGALVYEVELIPGTSTVVHGLESLVGYDQQDILAIRDWWHSVIHPEDLRTHLAQLDELIEKKGTDVCEYRVKHKHGQWIFVQDNRLVISNEMGQPVRLVGAVIDITARKQTETRLALLAEISEMLRNFDDPYDLLYTISEAVGKHLNVKRVLFNEVDLEQDREIVHRDYHNGVESVVGIHKITDYSSVTSAQVASGRTVVNTDSKIDPRTAEDYEKIYAVHGERAYVVVPLIRENGWVASLWVSDDAPRQWTSEEVSLLETVAERVWAIIEKLRINTALRESERRFREMIDALPAAIYTTDAEGRLTHFNPAAVEFSVRVPEIGTDKWCVTWKLYYADGSPMPHNECPMAITLKEGRVVRGVEAIAERPDGKRIWFEPFPTPLLDNEGRVVGGINMLVDITERKRAEEALRRNEQMFSTMVDSAPFGVYFIDSEFRLRAINKGSDAVFSGIHPLLGRDFAEILRIIWQEPFATETIERFRHTLRTGELFVSPTIIEERANIDEIQSYDWQIHRIMLSDGTFGVVCYFYDLSDQKKMEATVRASEALYRAIARSIPGGGVYVVDKDYRYLVAEGPVTEAFGLSREMLEGHTVSEVFPGERGARMEERLQKNFAGERVDFETIHKGRVYWTQQAPLHDSIGQAIILTLDITERKQAEEALRELRKRFRAILRQATAGIVRKDAKGKLLFVNEAFCNILGYTEEDLIGKTAWEFMHPDDVAENKKLYDRLMVEGIPFKLERRFVREDGSVIWVDASVSPIMDATGKPQSAVAVEVDITERKQTEEALHESEERFRAILGQATAGIARKDAEGRYIFVNQAYCDMVGYTESELLNKTCWDHMHEDDIPENKRLYDRMMREGVPFKIEKRLIRKNGSIVWVEVSLSPIMDAAGKPQSGVAVEVDITGRKQAEEALHQLNLQLEDRILSRTTKLRDVNQTLREEISERQRVEEALRQSEALARSNEEKLSTLFDLLPVGISFLDPEGQIIQMNPALANIMKLPREQVLERSHQSRKYIRTNGTVMHPMEFASRRALIEGKTVYNVETGIIMEGGEVIWTSVSAAPVKVADVGAVVVTADITESKRAEQALKESRERLQILSQRLVEVQEEERRAIARELHDRVGQTLAALNINLIIISSQLGGKVDEQTSSRLNDSMKLVAETIALVRDVMSNLRPSVLDDYGLEAAIDSHLTQYTSRYEISVRFEKPEHPIPRLGPSVEMTFLRIAQEALMNIARHAQATQVHLKLWQEDRTICMTVQDNGTGIASWQDANRPGSHGLTIMRERAEAFGGNLTVSSVPGNGTTVQVQIPFEANDKSPFQEGKSQ